MRDQMRDKIALRLGEAGSVIRETSLACAASIEKAADCLAEALQSGHHILLFGNGGSAAEAEHIAGELVGKYLRQREAYAAICLNTNMSIMTAVANDYDFSCVFARQIEAVGRVGDVAFGLSTSGMSPNIIQAFTRARERGLRTVLLTGRSGGNAKAVADICICVPSDAVPRVQEAHLAIAHTICEIVEELLARSA